MSEPATPISPDSHIRRTWRITGQVQGVGFRPFVYRLANSLSLHGTVRNDPRGVTVDAWGTRAACDAFTRRVATDAPALADVQSVTVVHESDAPDDTPGFSIIHSDSSPQQRGRVTVDSATCADCLRELHNVHDRRYRHALINCTNCGPRYTIVRDLPYDRPLTTMADFPMCAPCEAEYTDPGDRRFHAQPTCCPQCGPRLVLVDAHGTLIPGDPIDAASLVLTAGKILAIKGLGGYHLAVLADDQHAVQRLRKRKQRDRKPFALMARDLAVVRRVVHLDDTSCGALQSPASPIVLLRQREPESIVNAPLAAAVAPDVHRLGVMLPNTPIQHLLFMHSALTDRWLVMTSANLSDDPLVIDDNDARRRLEGIADAYLLHDRPIQRAVDDSIFLQVPDGLIPLRRARGYVPAPIPLPLATPSPGLCVGAELKNTVCLVRDREAILSQHLGDLTYALACERFERTIDDLQRLFDITPAWIACDLHPDIESHRYAQQRAAHEDIPVIPIQHHHAHAASLMAEHNRTEPITAVVCDGVGLGDDGTAWGGEVLLANLTTSTRLVRLRPLALPGGDAAAKETIRCALSWIVDALDDDHDRRDVVAKRIVDDNTRCAVLMQMLHRDVQCPLSSGTGRLFDAAAAVLGVCRHNEYEAQSGMMLESLAHDAPCLLHEDDLSDLMPLLESRDARGAPVLELDHRPLLRRMLDEHAKGTPVTHLARLFHEALANGWLRAVLHVVNDGAPTTVGLTGGVFCNALLTELLTTRLTDAGMQVLRHHLVPPNDGGIAYGQAAIAAARLAGQNS